MDSLPATRDNTVTTLAEPRATLTEAASLPRTLQFRLAAWLRVSEQFAVAAALLDLIAAESGETATLLDERATLALARGDVAAVRACWEERLSWKPAPSARAGFARALLELGELAAAAAITEDLLANHGELATVQLLAAEVAARQGDFATAREFWTRQLETDPARIAPLLALARLSLLAGRCDEARDWLTRALADAAELTPAQLATAAGLAELLGQTSRAQALRVRNARLEAARAAALAAEIDAALGRPRTPNGSRETSDLPEPIAPAPVNTPATEADEALEVLASEVAAPETVDDPRVLETLRAVFGFTELLPGQAPVINRVLAGRDTLGILPTGAGKSLTFQLPALLLPGVTLVLSPLIALMKDQVEGLPPTLRERTALVNSTLSPAEQQRALTEIAAGRYALVYAAPERLRQHTFLRALRQAGVSLVVVDEAHCISLWGHDFRPDYLSIPAALPELGNPPLLAMTATASPETATGIAGAFRRDLDIVRTSSFRPNLFYAAEKFGAREDKARRIIALSRELGGQGIVYVSSRRDAENLAAVLGDNGVSAVPYHAGLDPRRRADNQERFMRGAARVVVATIAFGMGVDKRDVRFIIHFSPSTSLEAYAQESGRAGRDGEDSRCLLLYTSADRAHLTRLARRDALDLPALRLVYAGVKRHAVGRWAIFDPSRIVLPTNPDGGEDAPDPRIGIGMLVEGKLLARHPNAAGTYALSPRRNALTPLPPSPAAVGEGESDADSAAIGDAPPSAALTREDAALWERLVAWAGLEAASGRRVTLETARVCEELGINPETLARVLETQGEWEVSEGNRMSCLELLPVEADAGLRLQRVLDVAAQRASTRVDKMMRYAQGRRCRHAELAAHLGERLPPCGDACDVCTGESGAATSGSREQQPRKRTAATIDDALATLKALASAPFPLGKTGLIRLLEGSIQSRIQDDRSAYFGALADLQKTKIEATINALVSGGALVHDQSGDFPLLRLTREGLSYLQLAQRDDTADFEEMLARSGIRSQPAARMDGETLDSETKPVDDDVLDRLRVWRRERSLQDGVPAYVVAPNASLAELAQQRPATIGQLSQISGFGQTRIEKYGQEILAVIAGTETL